MCIRDSLRTYPVPEGRPRLSGEDWRGAFGVFLLVFLSTFPVVIPFLFICGEGHLAVRVSNGVAILMLFGAGHMLAGYARLNRIRTGLAMVAIGTGLVLLTIALGG